MDHHWVRPILPLKELMKVYHLDLVSDIEIGTDPYLDNVFGLENMMEPCLG